MFKVLAIILAISFAAPAAIDRNVRFSEFSEQKQKIEELQDSLISLQQLVRDHESYIGADMSQKKTYTDFMKSDDKEDILYKMALAIVGLMSGGGFILHNPLVKGLLVSMARAILKAAGKGSTEA